MNYREVRVSWAANSAEPEDFSGVACVTIHDTHAYIPLENYKMCSVIRSAIEQAYQDGRIDKWSSVRNELDRLIEQQNYSP